jgi:ABC-2 type transport system permease protein
MNTKFLKSGKNSILILLVFLLALNYLVAQKSLYLDLTQDKIYTASAVSKNILGSLRNPVTVTFYISKDLPADYVNYRTQVQDLLGQYSDLSRGKLLIKYVEPGSDDKTVQDLEQKGIQQLQSQVVEKDKIEVKRFFFGAEITYGEGDSKKKEVLATVPALESFEYNFVSAINSVSKDQKEVIAFLNGQGEKEINSSELKKSYEVDNVTISTDSAKKGFYITDSSSQDSSTSSTNKPAASQDKKSIIPKTLVIAGPQNKLSDAEIAVLNDFVANGGKVVVLAEKINPDFSQGFVTKNIENNISDFTKKYGIEINNDLVYDQSNLPISYGKQTSFGQIQMTSDYPFWVRTIKDGFSDDPALSKIQSITFLWASSLKITSGSEYDVKNLITSTSGAETKSDNIDISPEANLTFVNSSKKTLAAVSTVKNGSGQVIVIGDSDFVTPSFMQPIPDNEIFFMNLIDSISSSANLSSIRLKNISQRPLRETSEGEKNYWKFFVIFGSTIILGAYGFSRISKRRKISQT